MAKTVAELQAELKAKEDELKKLTKAHETIVADNEKTIEQLRSEKEKLEAKAEEARAEAKKQREQKAEEDKRKMAARIKASPHHWVQVFNTGLQDGVDFAFNFEGLQFRLISGEPVYISEIIINHLKRCGYPKVKLKQGEAGQPVKVEGFHHNFNVVACNAPEGKEAVSAGA